MIELGSFSNESFHKIDSLCRQKIKSSNSNGFIISLEESVNNNMIWNDMTDSFKSELQSLYVHKNQFEVSWETLVALYAEDLIRKYFETIGYVSYFAFSNICEDVYKALRQGISFSSIVPILPILTCHFTYFPTFRLKIPLKILLVRNFNYFCVDKYALTDKNEQLFNDIQSF